MRVTKKLTAFFMAFLLVLGPVAGIPLATEGNAASEVVLKTRVSTDNYAEDGTVTVTVSLNTTVHTQGFGLDYATAYDHTVFEWVSGDWSQQVKAGSMLTPVNPGTQAAFGGMSSFDVSGDIFSIVLKPLVSLTCAESYEIKVLPSSKLDAVAEGDTVSLPHTYDNACDSVCNACSAKRYVKHQYDGAQDTTCSACGAVRALPTNRYVIHRGDQVQMTFALTNASPVTVRGFGMDFRGAYDPSAFEWVSGTWSETILEKATLQSVNPEKEAVFAATSEFSLSGDVFTLVLKAKEDAVFDDYQIVPELRKAGDCVISTATVTVHECKASAVFEGDENGHWSLCETAGCTERFNVTSHGYTNSCDAVCDDCGYERTVTHDYSVRDKDDETHWMKCSVCSAADESTRAPHGYDNACDTTCDVCDNVRVITHDYSVRDKDDENHWMKCSVCSAIDESSRTAHTYDNACDTTCNACDNVRVITHDYSVRDKDDETHWMKCSVCSAIDESSRAPHGYDNACDTTCDACDNVRVITHDYSVRDKDDENHWMKCSVCSAIDESSRTAHTYDNACDTTCDACDNVRVITHDYSVRDKDDENHWMKCSVCSAIDESSRTPHAYDDHTDLICDACGFERPPYVVGDTDGNGEVTLEDAIHLLFAINFPESYSLGQPADFDSSGEVDSDDAIYLLFYVNFKENYPLFPGK